MVTTFSLQKHSKRLVIPVSFPDVKGTLPPAITAAFVNAAPTIWRIKISTLTHKTFSTDNRCNAGFLPSYILLQTMLFHFTNNPSVYKK